MRTAGGHADVLCNGCSRVAIAYCASCQRPVCVWHSSGRPMVVVTGIALVAVCSPGCDQVWWKLKVKPKEARPALVQP